MHSQLALIALVLPLMSCGRFDRVHAGPVSVPIDHPQQPPPMAYHDLTATDLNGQLYKFDQLPQYAQLQELYEVYKDKGLIIIGFPSNDFGKQEPGSEAEIATFCQKNYGVTFPMMGKVQTKGEGQHAVYNWLTHKELNGVLESSVKWNFHKYLIDADGHFVMSLGSAVSPLDKEIVEWLGK